MTESIVEHLEKAPLTRFHYARAVFALVHFLGAITIAVIGTETKGKALEEISIG